MELSCDVTETSNTFEKKNTYGLHASKNRTCIPRASRWRKLAVMTCGLIQQVMTMGLGFGLSVMYTELIAKFNSDRSNVSVIQGLYLGLNTGAGILWTGVIKKFGPGPAVMVGSLVSAAGFFVSAFVQNLPTLIILVGFIAGMGMCTCYLSAFIAVSWIFHDNPGFPLTCLTIGSSLGQFIIPLLFELFISNYAWAGAFILASGLALQCLPCGFILHTSRGYYATDDITTRVHKQEKQSTCEGYATLLKDPLLWIILLDFLLIASTGNVEAWFMVDIMTSRGFPRERGSILVSTLGFANCLGRISGSILRFIFKQVPTVYHWIWICPLIAVGHALVVNITNYWPLFGAFILQGFAFGMNNSQTPTVTVEASGIARYPQAMSLVNLMYGLGNLTSNLMGGSIKDVFGEYDIAFYIAIGAAMIVTLDSGIASCIIYHRKHRKELLETGTKDDKTGIRYARMD